MSISGPEVSQQLQQEKQVLDKNKMMFWVEDYLSKHLDRNASNPLEVDFNDGLRLLCYPTAFGNPQKSKPDTMVEIDSVNLHGVVVYHYRRLLKLSDISFQPWHPLANPGSIMDRELFPRDAFLPVAWTPIFK